MFCRIDAPSRLPLRLWLGAITRASALNERQKWLASVQAACSVDRPFAIAGYIDTMIKCISAKTQHVVLVCRKCSKKIGGGFGKRGNKALAAELRALSNGKKGRRVDVLVHETSCLKLCPKAAVVAIAGTCPGEWFLIPAGSDVKTVAARLGITKVA